MPNRFVAAFAFLVVLIPALACPAEAQSERQKGIRAGVGATPGQAFIGAHMDWKDVSPKLLLRPTAEIGFGDGRTMFTLDADFIYFVKPRTLDWVPYVGGGPALVVQAFRSGQGKSGVGPGFDFVVGIKESKGLLIEVKAGSFDSPRFRAALGWTW